MRLACAPLEGARITCQNKWAPDVFSLLFDVDCGVAGPATLQVSSLPVGLPTSHIRANMNGTYAVLPAMPALPVLPSRRQPCAGCPSAPTPTRQRSLALPQRQLAVPTTPVETLCCRCPLLSLQATVSANADGTVNYWGLVDVMCRP